MTKASDKKKKFSSLLIMDVVILVNYINSFLVAQYFITINEGSHKFCL